MGSLSWDVRFKSSHCNSFRNQSPLSSTGGPILKYVSMTLLYDSTQTWFHTLFKFDGNFFCCNALMWAVVIEGVPPKPIFYSYLAKSRLPITYFSNNQSFWNFHRSQQWCSLQNLENIGHLRKFEFKMPVCPCVCTKTQTGSMLN